MMTGTSGRAARALGNSSRPLIPGMLMSEKMRINEALPTFAMHCSAALADCANSITNRPALKSWRKRCRNSSSTSSSSSTTRISTLTRAPPLCGRPRPRENDSEFRKHPGFRINLDCAGMLLDDDIMAEREPEASSFSRRLCGEERIEHLVLNLGRNAGAVVANPDLDFVAKVPRRREKDGLIRGTRGLLPLHRRVEAIRDQIEEHPGDLLRQQLNRPADGSSDCSIVMLKSCFS